MKKLQLVTAAFIIVLVGAAGCARTATEDSKIYLHNTEVWGKITELGNGQVFIDDEPYGNKEI